MYKKYAIIVAGGFGSRMGSTLPKQYLLLAGKPVLMHTIRQFAVCGEELEIVVVIHPEMNGYWKELCGTYGFDVPHHVVYGGDTRFQSVKRGVDFVLQQTDDIAKTLISIHDAARPLVTTEIIRKSFCETTDKKACIVAVPSINSVREGDSTENIAKDRSRIWMVQTPQTFTADLLQQAFLQGESPVFTDDASVVEQLGQRI